MKRNWNSVTFASEEDCLSAVRTVAVMQQIFIELYNYRPAWAKCSKSDRTDFVRKVVEAVKGLKSAGVDVVGYGTNSTQTDHRAPYDFFCVYRVPNVNVQRAFEQQVAASGWYEYFEQVNVSGDANDFEAVLLGNAKMVRPAPS